MVEQQGTPDRSGRSGVRAARPNRRLASRRFVGALAACALSALAVPARADEQSRLVVARDIVKTAHMADTMRQLFPTLLNQMRPMLLQQGATNAVVDDLFKRFAQRLDGEVENFNDLSAQVYAREFSDEDLAGLLAFYRSTAGQHLIAKQPAIAQAMAGVGAQWGRGMAKEVIEEYQKEKTTPPPKL